MREAAGAVSGKSVVDSAEIRSGVPRSKVQKAASIAWHPMSPSAPVPKSHQPRQLKGA